MADSEPNKAAAGGRLEVVLAAYGADPAHWPESDRELASLLATRRPELSAMLDEARAVDSALARATRPVSPPGAAERLIARVAEVPGGVASFARHARARRHQRPVALPGRLAVMSALAASLALGLYLGASGHGDWLVPPLLAEESPDYLVAEFDPLDTALQFFEDDMEP